MKTTKIMSLALALVMLLGITTNASAQTIVHDGDSRNVTITYGVDMNFIVTIPSSIQINAVGIGTAEITASDVFLPVDSNLEVSISGHDYADKWEIISQADNTDRIEYFIYNGANEVENNDVIMTVAPGEAYDSVKSTTLTLSIDGIPTRADTYQDTLTFTAKVNASLINFYITFPNGETNTYTAYDGWTWDRWLNSEYNTGEFEKEYNQYDNKEQINYFEPNTNNKWYIVTTSINYDKAFTDDTILKNYQYYIYR